MGPINLRVRYRPVRIGWCVQEGNLEEYRKALRLTHTLWGGRFNPIIPLGNPELARSLVKVFRVDCLYCIGRSPEAEALCAEFKHLFWPIFEEGLFIEGQDGLEATFLDVYHPARHFYDSHPKDRERPRRKGTLVRWDPTDRLADVLLATFGAYPAEDDTGIDYQALFQKFLAAPDFNVTNTGVLPQGLIKEVTPSVLTAFDLHPDHFAWGRDDPGLYYGDVSDFTDVVNFWNLRASGIDVLYYDPACHDRLHEMTDHYLGLLRGRPKDPSGGGSRVAIWNKSRDIDVDLAPFGTELMRSVVSAAVWNGLNIKPPLMGFEEQSVLGTVSGDGPISATFALPPKPFFDDVTLHTQNVVVLVRPLVTDENVVLKPPYFPELNEYYGREAYFDNHAVRSEREGLGIVTGVTVSDLTVRALDVRTLVKKIFEACGMSAIPSPAGLVGWRLIGQMGGLQGCRVFKIAGVRELIRKYSLDQSFTRSDAVRTIGEVDPPSGRPRFSDYEHLYIEARERGSLKPADAFNYLLKKGVFRAGLRLLCPNCELKNWIHLDDIRTVSRCGDCGRDFNITSQLRDRDWAFRRSGVFGRDDHQAGGIPVALTLQQLQTALRTRVLAYTTGTELEPASANIQKCETDFVLLAESLPERTLQVVIGECKARGEITDDDVQKLALVADALTENRSCEAFIVFSKTDQFTPDEVERCKAAKGEYEQRVILLSSRELEPYRMYERAEKEFFIPRSAISLTDMVQATRNIYFEPRPKSPAQPPGAVPA